MIIEPHCNLLRKPHKNKLLYKIIRSSDLLDMLNNNYIYFNRVDKYKDDIKDADLPAKDKLLCKQTRFQYAPNVSITDYYNYCRSKTYACCFTTENTKYIWQHYSNNDPNAACIVFHSGNLVEYLNTSLQSSRLIIRKNEKKLYHDFFWINYGLVNYIDINEKYLTKLLPNPTEYIYLKDKKYMEENEFRISLGCLGFRKYCLPDGSEFKFPGGLQLGFNYKAAIDKKVIKRIELCSNYTKDFYQSLEKTLQQKGLSIDLKKY